jgi:hypothetical protein
MKSRLRTTEAGLFSELIVILSVRNAAEPSIPDDCQTEEWLLFRARGCDDLLIKFVPEDRPQLVLNPESVHNPKRLQMRCPGRN